MVHALLYADTATYAQKFRDERDLVCRLDLDTEFAYSFVKVSTEIVKNEATNPF